MGKSKFGKFIILGAIVGAAVSMFDQKYPSSKCQKDRRNLASEIRFYSKNPDILKMEITREEREILNPFMNN